MLLFGRSRMLDSARSREAIAFTVEVASRAREVIGQDVYAWSSFASPETGMMLWSARFDSLNDLEVAADKLSVANEYMDYVEEHDGLFVGPYRGRAPRRSSPAHPTRRRCRTSRSSGPPAGSGS